MGMIKEFKDFAMKGNVVDLAVAVIIGGAFQVALSPCQWRGRLGWIHWRSNLGHVRRG